MTNRHPTTTLDHQVRTAKFDFSAHPLARIASLALVGALVFSGVAVAPAQAQPEQISRQQIGELDTSAPTLVSHNVVASATSLADGPITISVTLVVTDETGARAPVVYLKHVTSEAFYEFDDLALTEGSITDG